jgi:hypothetical protein
MHSSSNESINEMKILRWIYSSFSFSLMERSCWFLCDSKVSNNAVKCDENENAFHIKLTLGFELNEKKKLWERRGDEGGGGWFLFWIWSAAYPSYSWAKCSSSIIIMCTMHSDTVAVLVSSGSCVFCGFKMLSTNDLWPFHVNVCN